MNTTQLRQIIKEAIVDRLKMIDEAGDKAALTAKINKIDEDIKEAHDIKNAIPTNINHYVDPEIIGDLMEDINKSIDELEAKKKELEEQLKSLDEARFEKGEDVGKKGKNFNKIAKSAGKKYGSKEAGKKVAGAILKKVVDK